MLRDAGCDLVFLPRAEEIYRDGYRYRVSENELSLQLEGAARPGHFDGVLTVVLKLLLLTRPDRAYFGEKDFQQLQLVEGLVHAFFLDTRDRALPHGARARRARDELAQPPAVAGRARARARAASRARREHGRAPAARRGRGVPRARRIRSGLRRRPRRPQARGRPPRPSEAHRQCRIAKHRGSCSSSRARSPASRPASSSRAWRSAASPCRRSRAPGRCGSSARRRSRDSPAARRSRTCTKPAGPWTTSGLRAGPMSPCSARRPRTR